MFNKKPRRNFRQRKEESSDEEDKQKDNRDGEKDEKAGVVVNKPSKVAHGRGITCTSKREVTPLEPDGREGEDGEKFEATAETEETGKDKEGIKKKTSTVLSFSDDKEALEPEFKLKKSSEKAVLFQARRKEAPPARTTQSTEPAGAGVPPSDSPGQDYGSQASSPQSLPHSDNIDDDDDDEDEDAAASPTSSYSSKSSLNKPIIIPNAKAIEAARRQRRNTRAQKEYIPLGKDGQSSAGSTPDHYTRGDEDPVDDDDDDELDNHERRIEFAPRLKSIKERIAERLGSDSNSLSGTEDEEQELWEETQIGKGFKRQPGEQSPSGSESSSTTSTNSKHERQRSQKKKKSKEIKKIPETLPSITVSMVKRRISGKLDSLKEVYRARQAELSKMEFDVESAKTSAETLEENSPESQLKFYRSMTLYTHNLVECLREKVVEINSLELELHTLLSGQMEALLAQRQQKIMEHADDLQQHSSGTDGQRGSSSETEGETNTGVKAEDDFDIPEDTRPSVEEQEDLQKQKADILLRSQAVFSDVQDEFCDVKKILFRFEEWRRFYSESYHSAYISLCLPKLLNPIIRHQLLTWNPLRDASSDFENLPWFTAVETFCHGHGHQELDYIDRQMLANVIERTVLPKITAFVELVWDPMSLHESVRLAEVCHRLREDYSIFEGDQSKPVKTLIEVVAGRLRRCVDDEIFIPLYPQKFLEDRLSPQSRFRDQQFWTAIKLLGNMGKWDLLLPESVLKELMLDKLLNRYLMVTLSSHTLPNNDLHACRRIADCLPLRWFGEEIARVPVLQSLTNHLVQKVHTICKQQPGENPTTRSAVVEVLQVLSRLRCHDSIMALAEQYHYQDMVYSHQLLNQDEV
ncbi:intron Large complex component GCFC2 isoform 2-T2 [Aulostomus maculatus]